MQLTQFVVSGCKYIGTFCYVSCLIFAELEYMQLQVVTHFEKTHMRKPKSQAR